MRRTIAGLALASIVACSEGSATDAGARDASADAGAGDAAADAGGEDRSPLETLQPTQPITLSTGNDTGQDEDPGIAIARDGSLVAAWYSNRAGVGPEGRQRKEIFLARSQDGATWTDPPERVTENVEWSFYPSLAEDASGTLHIAFMRWILQPLACQPDPSSCGAASPCCTGVDRRIHVIAAGEERELSPGPADEVPNILAASDGRLLVYYTSGYRTGDPVKKIWVIARDNTGWRSPEPVAGVGSPAHHDAYPFVVERSPGSFSMTWTRYDLAQGDNLFNNTTHTMLASSTDGINFQNAVALTAGGPVDAINVFPVLYPDHARAQWFALWVTMAGVVELPIDGTFPADLRMLDLPGYTPRVAPTATPGIFWGVWVGGSEPRQKIEYRFFAK